MNRRSDFFALPDGLPMRQYEALRAYLHEGCTIEEAAERGGYAPGSFRNLLTRFNKNPSADFFWPQLKRVLGQSCENTIFIAFWGRGSGLRDGSKWRLQIFHYFGIRGRVL